VPTDKLSASIDPSEAFANRDASMPAAGSSKTTLRLLFGCILVSLFIYTVYACTQQPIWEYTGLTTGQDRFWNISSLLDAYFGFTTFYVWVVFKERRWIPRIGWFIAIMLLGNMAMSSYILLQLARLRPGQPASAILTARNT
jgi:Protein of unknown function (DUF1475)